MNRIGVAILTGVLSVCAGGALAQVAGRTTLGATVAQMDAIVLGESAKKDILGKAVYNDQKQKIGKVDDIIITPDNTASFAIVGVGGFLGAGKKEVAIPMDQVQLSDKRELQLPGATKDALKALPAFEYAKKKG